MAINIPSGCYRQMNETTATDQDGGKSLAFVLKGPYTSLSGLSISQGLEIIQDWVAVSWNLAHAPGDTGILTINCVPKDTTQEEGQEPEQHPLKEVWSVKSCRNDMSILGYCGTAEENPVREWVEAWMKEPDGELAKRNCFTKSDGTIFDLSSQDLPATVDLLAKIKKGIDTVMRFYPMLVCRRTYSTAPRSVYENLSEISTPSPGNINSMMPGNLSTIISNHVWLKCQDDAEQQSDGKWIRTEAWMGAESWDANLYGPTATRWHVPYSHNLDAD